jgi:Coiled-coil domain containing protein (DUF2052)
MTTPAEPEDIGLIEPALTQAHIRNRRLAYLNRSNYPSTPANQQRLFPLLYQKLIIEHETTADKIHIEQESKTRNLIDVIFDAGDRIETLEQRRDRTDEKRAEDEARYEREQEIVESIPHEILEDREKSKEFLEKLLTQAFLAGEDMGFDYSRVDDDDKYDDWSIIEEDIRARYFDDETPESKEEGKTLTGETGIQDF